MAEKITRPEKKYCGKSYFKDGCSTCPYRENVCDIYEFNKLIDDMSAYQLINIKEIGLKTKPYKNYDPQHRIRNCC